MAITRAQIETILISRCGALLTKAGLDGETHHGVNASLNDPIGRALRGAGYSVTTLTNVTDADVASVSDDDIDLVLDLAELRTLESVSGNLDDVAITVGPRSEQKQQLADQVLRKIERLQQKIERQYGVGMGTLTAGVIGLDFMETSEDE